MARNARRRQPKGNYYLAAGVGELGATSRLDRAPTLHRDRVEQYELVVEAGALEGEYATEPVDRLGQPAPALVVARLLGQLGEQVREPPPGDRQKAAVGGDPHDGLRPRRA